MGRVVCIVSPITEGRGIYTINKDKNTLCKGIILDLAIDTDMEETVSMHVKDGEITREVIYHEALYSQLNKSHIGEEISLISEISLWELKSEEYKDTWEMYVRERSDDGGALVATPHHEVRRLFIHKLKNGECCLVVAMSYETAQNKNY